MTIKPIITQDNIVLYLPMNENSGSIIYDYIGNNNGTANGTNIVKLPNGNYARSFNANDDYIDVTGITTTSNSFSFGGWFNITSTKNERQYVLDAFSGRMVINIRNGASGNVIEIYDGNVFNSFGKTPILNAWTHYFFIIDGNSAKVYENGSLLSNITTSQTIVDIGGDIYIGGNTNNIGTNHFGGVIDKLLLYNKILTEEEIKVMYKLSYKV